jgi:hypothetical protein
MRMHRFTFGLGLVTGYVLGARAGRGRYEQISKLARSVADSPAVQQAASAVQEQATGTMKSTVDRATAGYRKGAAKVRQRTADSGSARFADPATSGNGAGPGPAKRDQRPFVPVNGEFGDHDMS